MEMKNILRRVEKATGDRDDDAIAERRAINAWLHDNLMPEPKVVVPLNYCSSLDAAVALCERVLPGHKWSISKVGYDDGTYQDGKAGAYLQAPYMSFFNIRAFATTPAPPAGEGER